MEKLTAIYFIGIIFVVSGCAPKKDYQHFVGFGTVVQQKKITNNPEYDPKKSGLTGAEKGAAIGMTAGAATGTFAGLALTAVTLGLAAPAIPAFAAGGAAIGGAAGVGTGYASDMRHRLLYQYTVQPDGQDDTFAVLKYEQNPINVNSRVRITLKNGQYYIEPAVE
ncbi:MAG: hypothetical protein ACNA7Y_03010 [Gammaproteobacteria bacterium]